jgi:hypothetical protein
MISLTYPGDWREWAGSGPVIRRQINNLKRRWLHKWGEPIRGVWVREFQKRGAPHWHIYVGLPEAVTDEDYDQLVERTKRRKRMEPGMGTFEARRRVGPMRGDFARWLLSAWSLSVGTEATSYHAKFGADVAPMFWGATVAEAAAGKVNWAKVADYLWRESGKWGQKTVPEDFSSPGRTWGRWGVTLRVSEGEVTRGTAMEMRRVLRDIKLRQDRRERGPRAWRALPRGSDGLTVFGLEPEAVFRLLRWAEAEAMRKAQEKAARPDSERSERSRFFARETTPGGRRVRAGAAGWRGYDDDDDGWRRVGA